MLHRLLYLFLAMRLNRLQLEDSDLDSETNSERIGGIGYDRKKNLMAFEWADGQ